MLNYIREIKYAIESLVIEQQQRKRYEDNGIMLGKSVTISPDSKIGKYTYIGDYSKVSSSVIGRYVSIGSCVNIGPGEHRIKYVSTSYRLYKNVMGSEYYDGDDGRFHDGTRIGNDVWIGANSIIRRGVTVGNGAVIGANAFVNRDVPDYSVVAGNPGRVIKYRFEKSVIDELIKSEWWLNDLEDARRVINSLADRLQIDL